MNCDDLICVANVGQGLDCECLKTAADLLGYSLYAVISTYQNVSKVNG